MKRTGILTGLFIWISNISLAVEKTSTNVQKTDDLFFSKVVLAIIIACIGVMALRTYRKRDKTQEF